ncbi:RNase H family protein, partial [Striga hermonthica]
VVPNIGDPVEGCWTLYVDGSSNQNGSGARLTLTSPEGHVFNYALRFEFKASNNEAYYEALITGLKMALELGSRRVQCHSDSQLVVCQSRGDYEAKDLMIVKYETKVKYLVSLFEYCGVQQVVRTENTKADALSNLATSPYHELIKTVPVEVLPHRIMFGHATIDQESLSSEKLSSTTRKGTTSYLQTGTALTVYEQR